METIVAENLHNELIKKIENMTVLELVDFLKALEKKFDIAAVMPAKEVSAAPTGGEAVAKKEEKAEYKLMLKDVGSEKIKVIKILRKIIPNIELSKIRKMLSELPAVIAESVPKEDAMKMKKELEDIGAKVELS